MKKVLSILVLALVAVQFAFAGDVITQDAKQLPLTARNFINQYFSKPHISHIKIESEILQTKKYEVLLLKNNDYEESIVYSCVGSCSCSVCLCR